MSDRRSRPSGRRPRRSHAPRRPINVQDDFRRAARSFRFCCACDGRHLPHGPGPGGQDGDRQFESAERQRQGQGEISSPSCSPSSSRCPQAELIPSRNEIRACGDRFWLPQASIRRNPNFCADKRNTNLFSAADGLVLSGEIQTGKTDGRWGHLQNSWRSWCWRHPSRPA